MENEAEKGERAQVTKKRTMANCSLDDIEGNPSTVDSTQPIVEHVKRPKKVKKAETEASSTEDTEWTNTVKSLVSQTENKTWLYIPSTSSDGKLTGKSFDLESCSTNDFINWIKYIYPVVAKSEFDMEEFEGFKNREEIFKRVILNIAKLKMRLAKFE